MKPSRLVRPAEYARWKYVRRVCAMRALVSGGSSGIGAAASLRLAEAALARGEKPMIAVSGLTANAQQDEVVRSIQSLGGKAIALTGDLGDPDVPGQLVTAVVDE